MAGRRDELESGGRERNKFAGGRHVVPGKSRSIRAVAARRLSELARLIGAKAPSDTTVTGLSVDSRRVRPGDLFVALPGSRADGRAFAADARQRGAVGVVAREPVDDFPTVEVADPRAAVPRLAAALHDFPAERVRLIGVTGTLGKTSAAFLLRDMLSAHGEEIGVIGSLGIHLGDEVKDTGMTTPDAPVLQEALHDLADRGVGAAAMEVTSHALMQHRIDGLSFAIGLLTNLVPDEHLEFHPTPEHYLQVKTRFFEYLAPSAPLVVNADDELARAHTRGLPQPVIDVSASPGTNASVSVEDLRADAGGSQFILRVNHPLQGPAGEVPAQAMPLRLAMLGQPQVMNCALAATVALLLGATPAAIADGAARAAPIRRRMQTLRAAAPMVIDDSTGNPRSLRAIFDTVRMLDVRGETRILFGIRGMRGTEINTALANSLNEFLAEHPARLVVTASEDAAGPRDRVQTDERECFLDTLAAAGTVFDYCPTLGVAVDTVAYAIGPDDLILLLGAQGVDRAAPLLLSYLD